MVLPDVYKYDGPERTPQQWSHWLRSNAHDFQGHTDNAGLLMASFMKGRRFVIERFGMRGVKIPAPEIKLTKPEPRDPFYNHAALNHYWSAIKRNTTWINLGQLGEFSRHDAKDSFIFPDASGLNRVHTGSIKDYYSLIGAEETHHAFFAHFKGGFLPGNSYESGSVTDHDAVDPEFRALLVVMKFARADNLPQETLLTIEDRIRKARELRRARAAI